MVDKISNYILDNVLYKNEKIEGDSREIMLFGITRIVEDVPKYIVILAIGLIYNIIDLILYTKISLEVHMLELILDALYFLLHFFLYQ